VLRNKEAPDSPKRVEIKRHFRNYSCFISHKDESMRLNQRAKGAISNLSPRALQLRTVNMRRNMSISKMSEVFRVQNRKTMVSLEQIIQTRDSPEPADLEGENSATFLLE
jgi:hypothetical protein